MRRYLAILPKDEEDADGADDLSIDEPVQKQRRVAVSVACNPCRRRKIRCDGRRPNCSNCEGSAELCTYRDESELSQESQQLLLEVFRLLNALPDQNILRKLRSLKNEIDVSVILSTLRHNKGTRQQPADTSSNPIQSDGYVGEAYAGSSHPEYTSGRMPRLDGLEQVLWPLGLHETGPSSGTWSNITDDMNLVYHLFALYFSWEYPLFAPFGKEAFLKDFHNGRHRHCSPLLVNALLALGCRLSALPMTRANPNDPMSSGTHFFDEALRLLDQESDRQSLTTIQALGIMSVREISCGRDTEGQYYSRQSLRLAIEMGLHRKDHDEDTDDSTLVSIRSSTFWGAYSLDNLLSLATGSLPQYTHLSSRPSKPVILGDIEASLWVPYTDDGVPLGCVHEQPSNVLSVYECFCGLSVIIHDSLFVLHSPVGLLTAEVLLKVYTQYLEWYNDIPEVLRLGHNSTPTVLFVHMCYHFAILHLFHPLLRLRILGSEISPRYVCHQAADAIQGLLRAYSQLYTLLRTPSLVPVLTLASAISHIDIRTVTTRTHATKSDMDVEIVANKHRHISEAVREDIANLTEMAPCHRSAKQALDVLALLAEEAGIDVGVETDDVSVDEYDRIVRPYTKIVSLMARNVRGQDFLNDL